MRFTKYKDIIHAQKMVVVASETYTIHFYSDAQIPIQVNASPQYPDIDGGLPFTQTQKTADN